MKRIVIYGECMVELRTESAQTLTKSYAGDTYNSAVYLKRCLPSSSVSFLTAIGADFLSDELMFNMGENEINTDYVFRSVSRNLGLYMIRNDEHGERDFAYWRSQSAATQTFTLLEETKTSIHCDWFYFSGISIAILDVPQRESLFAVIDELAKNGSKIVFDPNYRASLWDTKEDAQYWTERAYQVSDLTFPGADDHLMLYGHRTADDIFSYLANKNIDEIVVKNGSVGVHILEGKEQRIVPVERVEQVIDTTAAGDAFNGGYLAARLSGKKPVESASYGAKVAATVITYPGAIIPLIDFNNHIPTL